jgi:hypothetical protein
LYGGPGVDWFASAEAYGTLAADPGILVAGTTESFPPLTTPPGVSGERMWAMALDLGGNTNYNMACMVHEPGLEYKLPEVQDPGHRAQPRETAIGATPTKLADAPFDTQTMIICP